jgi:hypothetical protein
MVKVRKSSPPNSFFLKVNEIALSSKGLPIILTISMICIVFVVFRMQRVELEYEMNLVRHEIEKADFDNKEFKAMKANYLSVNRLKELAKKYDLKEPSQEQIILIK